MVISVEKELLYFDKTCLEFLDIDKESPES
jgi:hypothetical protein